MALGRHTGRLAAANGWGTPYQNGPLLPGGMRRSVAFTERSVPTLHQGLGAYDLADGYYWIPGIFASASGEPPWAPDLPSSDSTFQNWDGTEKRRYLAIATGGASLIAANPRSDNRFVYYGGPWGLATEHMPKNFAEVSRCVMTIRGKFATNGDYSDFGIGCKTTNWDATPPSPNGHAIIVSRDGSAWELGTADGTTYSVGTGGTADANWHTFQTVIEAAAVLLYVDGALMVTKTTNLPTEPMSPSYAFHGSNSDPFYLHDWRFRWE